MVMPPRRLAVAGALAGLLIPQVTGLVVALLFRATEGEFNRGIFLVSVLTGVALGVGTGLALCRMQGRSFLHRGPRDTYGLVAVTIAGLAAGAALRWAIVRPWEGSADTLDYVFMDGAAVAGAASQVWVILTGGKERGPWIPRAGRGPEG